MNSCFVEGVTVEVAAGCHGQRGHSAGAVSGTGRVAYIR